MSTSKRLILIVLVLSSPLYGQAIRRPAGSEPSPIRFRGLVPGTTPLSEILEKLGKPAHRASWYDTKLLYPSSGREGFFDALHVISGEERDGVLGTIESASIPKELETRACVRRRLGKPEFLLELHRQTIADYARQGLRFVFDIEDRTTGVAYFPSGKARVHAGSRRKLSLRSLRQGPQPAPAKAALPADLRVGAATVDLSPRDPSWLGFNEESGEYRIHDPLRARCGVVQQGGLRVALVGADLFALALEDVRDIEASLKTRGIDYLLIASSHNHAAGDTIGIYGQFPTQYVAYIKKQIEAGVLKAFENLGVVTEWKAASDELALDGARVSGLIRNARNPGLVDPQLAVIQAIGADGKAIVTLVNFACHVEGLEKGVLDTSADFPGYLTDALAKKYGGTAIFLNGALGGMVTGDTSARTHAEAKKAGLRFAAEVERLIDFAVSPEIFQFRVERRPVEIPLTNPRFRQFVEAMGRRKLKAGRAVTEMLYLNLGDAELITVPGELSPELGFEILAEMRGYPRMIVGLANDELGYILPAYDFNEGGYEESMSPGPAAGPVLREQAIRMIREARGAE